MTSIIVNSETKETSVISSEIDGRVVSKENEMNVISQGYAGPKGDKGEKGDPGGAIGAAGGVLSGEYPNPGFAEDMATQAELNTHTGNTSNPHSVTASQVGAYTSGEVDTLLSGKSDTTHNHDSEYDAFGAASSAMASHVAAPDPHSQYATDSDLSSHTGNTSNPHSVTASQVGAYTSGEVDTLLSGKADSSHEHTISEIKVPASRIIGAVTGVDYMDEILNGVISAGSVSGFDTTDNLDGTFDIAAGEAFLRESASDSSTMYACAVPALAGITLNDRAVSYVYIDYNAGSPQIAYSTSINSFNCLDKCLIYMVHRIGTELRIINARSQTIDGNRKTRRMFLEYSKFIPTESGSVIGSSGLAVTVTAGKFYFMLQEQPHDAFDTSVAGTANANVFDLYYRDGAGSFTVVHEQKTINSTVYDSGTGIPTTLGTNKYGASWVYISHNDPSTLTVVMGQEQYVNLASAMESLPPSIVPSIIGISSLVGRLVYQNGASSFIGVTSMVRGSYGSSGVTEHNDLSGIQGGALGEYNHLTDAEIANLGTLTGGSDASPLHNHNTDYNTKSEITAYLSGKADSSHAHTASDISDFSEAVDDRVGALLVAGSNVTITYNDPANTITIDSAAGGVSDHGALTGLADDDHTQYALADGTRGNFAATSHGHTASDVSDFSEAVDDRVGSLLVAGSNITLTYDDTGNSLTIAATGTLSGDHGTLTGLADDDHTQYALADGTRGNFAATSHGHTASDVSDFSEAVDDRVAALLVAGSNVTLTYDDPSNTLTVAASGGVTDHGALTGLADDDHTQYALADGTRGNFAATSHGHTASDVSDFSEAVDDRVSALLVAGSNITLTYNDPSNTLTIAASGGGSDPWTYVSQTADESNSTTIAVLSSYMTFSMDNASKYEIEGLILFTTPTTTTGIGIGFYPTTWPTGNNCGFWTSHTTTAAYSVGLSSILGTTSNGTTPSIVTFKHMAITTSTGTATISFRSEVASSNVTILAGSFIKYRKVT